MESKKIQQTGEYNKKEADTDIENKLEVTIGGGNMWGGVGSTNYWVEDRLKYVLYDTRNIANIL